MPSRTAPPEAPFLLADDVGVALDGKPILSRLSFSVARGTWTGLIGPNGSGKTTLLRAISGAVPYQGHLALANQPVASWSARALARTVAFVRQSPTLAFDFSVEELVRLGRAPHKSWLAAYSSADRSVVRHALQRVGLDGFAQRSVLSLSGGELQRVFLAQALAQEADLLLLDEPTTHLDVHHQFTFMDQVRAFVQEGRAAIAVFHDLELAARYADRLLLLSGGTLVAEGPPADVLTAERIASVFRMDAHAEAAPDGSVRIRYRAPVAPG